MLINPKVKMIGLQNSLLNALKLYLCKSSQSQLKLSYFYIILELLKQKYINDFNFIEHLKYDLQSYNNSITVILNIHTTISNISTYIHQCNNENLLKELITSIDILFIGIGIKSYLEKLITENINIEPVIDTINFKETSEGFKLLEKSFSK